MLINKSNILDRLSAPDTNQLLLLYMLLIADRLSDNAGIVTFNRFCHSGLDPESSVFY